MGTRSSFLYDIEDALKERGIYARIGSVRDLRTLLPGYSESLDLAGLMVMLKQIPTADLEVWKVLKKEPRNRGRQPDTKKREKVLRLRSKGLSVSLIAKKMGLSRSRIYQLLKEELK